MAATAPHAVRCSRCRRTPLIGERLFVLESERALCELCHAQLPERKRGAVRTEMVHASERRLAVVPAA